MLDCEACPVHRNLDKAAVNRDEFVVIELAPVKLILSGISTISMSWQ